MSKWVVTEKGIRVNVDHLIAYNIETRTECILKAMKDDPDQMQVMARIDLHTPIQCVTLETTTYADIKKRLEQLDYLMSYGVNGIYTLDDLSKLYPGGRY